MIVTPFHFVPLIWWILLPWLDAVNLFYCFTSSALEPFYCIFVVSYCIFQLVISLWYFLLKFLFWKQENNAWTVSSIMTIIQFFIIKFIFISLRSFSDVSSSFFRGGNLFFCFIFLFFSVFLYIRQNTPSQSLEGLVLDLNVQPYPSSFSSLNPLLLSKQLSLFFLAPSAECVPRLVSVLKGRTPIKAVAWNFGFQSMQIYLFHRWHWDLDPSTPSPGGMTS